MFTCNAYVCVCDKLQEWVVLWQKVIIFTLNVYIFKKRTVKIKEKRKCRRYVRVNLYLFYAVVTGHDILESYYTHFKESGKSFSVPLWVASLLFPFPRGNSPLQHQSTGGLSEIRRQWRCQCKSQIHFASVIFINLPVELFNF